jgi:hypothetical protein
MRLTGLLALLLFFLIVFFAAPAASYAQAAQAPAAATDSRNDGLILEDSPLIEHPKPATDAPEVDRPLGLGQPLLEHGGDMVLRDFDRDGVCYTMRTYVMAREDKDSDVTRMVRYRKCLPAWKLNFKSAIAPVKSGRTP